MRPPQDLSFRFGDTPASPRPAIQAGLLRKKGPLALQLFQTSGVRFPVREDLKHMHLSESTLRRTGGPQSCIGEPFLLPLQSGVR